MTQYRYGQTWDDLGRTPRDRSWRMLRHLRQHPPGLAADDGDRRETFVAALEQAEQFYTAAAATGPQTRALLLFYGLSQAGRALRAAQQQDEGWGRAGSHGITVIGSSTSGDFADSLVWDGNGRPGAFNWVAATINRASLSQPTSVGDIARLLFPHAQYPLAGDDPAYGVLELQAIRDPGLSMGNPASSGLRANLRVPVSWHVELPDVPERTTEHYDEYRNQIRARLRHYPTLAGAELIESSPGYFQLQAESGSHRKVELVWPDLPAWNDDPESVLHRFSDQNRSTVSVWPTMPADPVDEQPALAAHPFVLWWAVLFTAAHFIRYEPRRWAHLVDVDASPEAVALEEIGDRALDAIPELIHMTLVRTEPQ